MNKIILTTSISCLLAFTAHAQQAQYSGGMQYTAIKPATEKAASEKPVLYNRQPQKQEVRLETPKDSALPAAPNTTSEITEEPSPTKSAWEKYKELAGGTAQQEQDSNFIKPEAPEKPSTPEKQSAVTDESEQNAPQTGIAGIISNYQKSKEQRGQIKSLTISKPQIDTPKVNKPSVSLNE